MSGLTLLIVVLAAVAAVWLFWKAATATRPRRVTEIVEAEPFAPASDLVQPFEAELLCQALEEQGIHCTFYGRANTRAAAHTQFADWRGGVRLLVRREDVARAREILSRPNDSDTPVEELRPVFASESTRTAAAAFGEYPSGRIQTFLRRVLRG
jgi:Putative prokaryotic signal transducing protein